MTALRTRTAFTARLATSLGLMLMVASGARAQDAKAGAPAAPVVEPPPAPPQIEAGLGKGATIRSADGRFSLNIRGRIQLRATVAGNPGSDTDPTSEIAIRRMRLLFQGQVLGPELTYYIQLGFSNQDTERDLRLPLRDAYINWAPHPLVNVRGGQMKVPYGRQRVNSSSALQMADRSIVVNELNLDRDVGVSLYSKDLFGLGGKLGYNVSVFGGEGRNRLGRDLGYLYAARLEAWPLGPFDDYVEGDVKRQQTLRMAIGTSVAYNQNTNRPRSTTSDPYAAGDFDYLHLGADVCLKYAGFSLVGEVMYRNADADRRTVMDDDEPITIASRSAWGAFAQAGQMVTKHMEVSARYGHLQPKRGTDPQLVRSEELGGALSYYFMGHDLKLQGDYFYLPVNGFDDGNHQGRLQAQLYF